jgi:hypothetical protein
MGVSDHLTLGHWFEFEIGEGQRAAYPEVRHFRIVTLDHTLDILATAEPGAEWPG